MVCKKIGLLILGYKMGVLNWVFSVICINRAFQKGLGAD
jgi:hypothetical protein